MQPLLAVAPHTKSPSHTHSIHMYSWYRRHQYLLWPRIPAPQTTPLSTQGASGHGQQPHGLLVRHGRSSHPPTRAQLPYHRVCHARIQAYTCGYQYNLWRRIQSNFFCSICHSFCPQRQDHPHGVAQSCRGQTMALRPQPTLQSATINQVGHTGGHVVCFQRLRST